MFMTILATQVVGITLGVCGAAVVTSSTDELRRYHQGKPMKIVQYLDKIK